MCPLGPGCISRDATKSLPLQWLWHALVNCQLRLEVVTGAQGAFHPHNQNSLSSTISASKISIKLFIKWERSQEDGTIENSKACDWHQDGVLSMPTSYVRNLSDDTLVTLWLAWPAGCLQSFQLSMSKDSFLWQHFSKGGPTTHLSLNYLDSLSWNRPFSGPYNDVLWRHSPATCHFSKRPRIIVCTLKPKDCCLRNSLLTPLALYFQILWRNDIHREDCNGVGFSRVNTPASQTLPWGNRDQARTPEVTLNPCLGTNTREDTHSPDWRHQLFSLFLNFT